MDKVWKPFRRQEDFIRIPDTVKEGLYGGAAMGGKSEVLLLLPIIRGFYKHPKFKGVIFRRTYPELEKEIILRSREWYPPTGAKFNDEKKRWTFPSGAIMQFGHVEYEQDVRKYDTTEYNYMAFDELTSFTEFQYRYLSMTRCRTPKELLDVLPPIVRSGTNPGNVGHSWVRKRFIEPGPYGTIILDTLTGLKRIFIQSKVTDNPHADPNYVNQLKSLPEAERRAKLDGDWWTFSGQVFDDWRETHFEDEPENACHVYEPFEIPSYWPRILAVDWGFAAMTCALWGAISPEGRLYIYREHTVKNTKISTWATDVGRLSFGEELSDAVMCRSAWQNRGDEQTIAEQFEKYSGIRPRQADNERVGGKTLIHEMLRWRQKPSRKILNSEDFDHDYAARIMRVQGMEAYKDYLSSFEPQEPETNIPILQVSKDCQELRKCIPLCVYEDKKSITGKPSEDVAEFDGDDPYDTIRYLAKAAERFLLRGNPEADYHSKVGKVIQGFQQNRDFTSFHRQMERIEHLRVKIQPIRRFRHA